MRKLFPQKSMEEILQLPVEQVFTSEHAVLLGYRDRVAAYVRNSFRKARDLSPEEREREELISVSIMQHLVTTTEFHVRIMPNVGKSSFGLIKAVMEDLGLEFKPRVSRW